MSGLLLIALGLAPGLGRLTLRRGVAARVADTGRIVGLAAGGLLADTDSGGAATVTDALERRRGSI